MRTDGHRVGTWATAPAPAEGVAFANHTYLQMGESIDLSLFD